MLNYPDKNYASGRLIGTIVRYKEKPVIVQDMSGDIVKIKNLLTGDYEDGMYPYLDINPVPLGYVNTKGNVYYVSRCPMRKDWKQGLRSQTIRAILIGDTYPVSHELNMKDVARTIIGDFPSLSASIKKLKDGDVSAIAFSRSFALDSVGNIWHKAIRNIGKLDFKTLKKSIKDEFFWTKEELEECVG